MSEGADSAKPGRAVDDVRKQSSDPSPNVRDLVEAREKRQDDLREALGKLLIEKIDGLDRRTTTEFSLRDTAAEKLSVASSTAIAAALQAQKDDSAARNESNAAGVAKTEAGFTKQIDGIGVLLSAATKSMDDKIADLKARLDRGEGHGKGLSDGWGYIVGAAGLIGGVLFAIQGAAK